MKHYYISNPSLPRGFEEVTKFEFLALTGDDSTRPYVKQVYRGELSINEVPEELREAVQSVVDAKIARFGVYASQDIPANELKNMIEEAI